MFAAKLNVSPLELVRWTSGEKPAPASVSIAALDIVAGGENRVARRRVS
jgi:hypothetical protein